MLGFAGCNLEIGGGRSGRRFNFFTRLHSQCQISGHFQWSHSESESECSIKCNAVRRTFLYSSISRPHYLSAILQGCTVNVVSNSDTVKLQKFTTITLSFSFNVQKFQIKVLPCCGDDKKTIKLRRPSSRAGQTRDIDVANAHNGIEPQ